MEKTQLNINLQNYGITPFQQTLKVDLKQQSRAEAKKIISEHFYNNY